MICRSFSQRAFTLIELLAVMALMSAMIVMIRPLIRSQKDLASGGYEIAGQIEQARAYAMANNTYVWAGLRQTTDGSLIMAVAASKDGSDEPPGSNTADAAAGIVQLGKIKKWENTQLLSLPPSSDRPNAVPLTTSTGAIYSFSTGPVTNRNEFTQYVIRFTPKGEARMIKGAVQKRIELGLQSAVNGVTRNAGDYVAIQVSGLSGNVTIYRP